MARQVNAKGLCECGCGQRTTIAEQSCTRNGYVKGEPRRFIIGHHTRKSPVEFIEAPDTHCWVWQLTLSNGYGDRWDGKRTRRAHILYYEELIGPTPEGKMLHHICHNRACVNPGHLEPVTRKEHAERHLVSHCPHGHPYDEKNTYWRLDRKGRECRACNRARSARRASERKAA